MDKEQALSILRQVCEQVSLPYAAHQQVQAALQALKPVVETDE